jgi:hypothetical protein
MPSKSSLLALDHHTPETFFFQCIFQESYDHRSGMDYIKRFDIELEKEVYYAGEKLKGHILVENIENIKVKGKYRFV